MRFNRRTLNAGLVASLTAPMMSRAARAADTLKIGMVLPVTGPAAAVGGYALAGAKIALDQVNKSGGVLGKQLELVTEDDQTTNPGAVLAFSKLAAQPDIIAFLGPVRSTQNHAIANDVLKTAKPFCFGGTDPKLTKMGNPWFIRFRPNDTYSARVIASYGIETLGKKNWALVHSTDAFGTSANNLLAAAIVKLGAKVAIDQGYPNQSQDFTPVVLAIKSSGADVIGSYFTYENDQAIFARQAKQLGLDDPLGRIADHRRRRHIEARRPCDVGHLRHRRLRHRLVSRSEGIRQALQRRLEARRPIFRARGPMTRLAFYPSVSTRRVRPIQDKIRDAMLSIKGYKGAEGEYNFDQFGDGLHGYNIVRNEKGTIVFDKHIEFTD